MRNVFNVPSDTRHVRLHLELPLLLLIVRAVYLWISERHGDTDRVSTETVFGNATCLSPNLVRGSLLCTDDDIVVDVNRELRYANVQSVSLQQTIQSK